MRSAVDIKSLRSSKGYFCVRDIVSALEEKGHKISNSTYNNKEKGRTPFTAVEIRLLSEILGITLEEAYDYFCE